MGAWWEGAGWVGGVKQLRAASQRAAVAARAADGWEWWVGWRVGEWGRGGAGSATVRCEGVACAGVLHERRALQLTQKRGASSDASGWAVMATCLLVHAVPPAPPPIPTLLLRLAPSLQASSWKGSTLGHDATCTLCSSRATRRSGRSSGGGRRRRQAGTKGAPRRRGRRQRSWHLVTTLHPFCNRATIGKNLRWRAACNSRTCTHGIVIRLAAAGEAAAAARPK